MKKTHLGDSAERNQDVDDAGRLAAIVESSNDAIISKDLNGIIKSWNPGAERLFGYTSAEIIGKPVLVLIPADRHNEEPGIIARIRKGERVEHYETVRRRKDGTLVDISLAVSPIKNTAGRIVGASKIARDITERKHADELVARQKTRLETLNQIAKMISQDLDLERTVQAVTDIATRLSGAKFGAFFYNIINEKGESFMLYSLSGAPREAFSKFGMPRNTAVFDPTFRGEGVVRVDDIRKDPRYGLNAPHHGMPKGHLPVVSYLAVPVKAGSGEVLGGLFFGHDRAGVFTQDIEDIIEGIASHAAIAIENARLHRAAKDEVARRARAEESKELLLNELQHRAKNTLGTVQAIASQTFRGALEEDRAAFNARLQALGRAHDLLSSHSWHRADIGDIVTRAVMPFREHRIDRFGISGGSAPLDTNSSLVLAMILHELGTNAVKYGALSNDSGKIAVTWTTRAAGGAAPVATDADKPPRQILTLVWREVDGPAVTPPRRKGFGSTLIERALDGERGSARIDYAADGVVCTLEIAFQP